MSYGLIAIFIIAIVIFGAIKTKKCIEFMIFGTVLASLVLYKQNFIAEWTYIFTDVLYAGDSVWLVLVCCFFGSLIALLQASKGSFGFAGLIAKLCKSERKTLLTSFILGILIFVDDYLNILTVGVCMKKVFDKNKIPRETLAYVIDSTGAPVCTLLPFSTWAVFFATLFIAEPSIQALGYTTGLDAYIAAIPFAFYPIFTLIVMFLFVMGFMPKLGAMKKVYQRVAETGKVYSDASRKYNHGDEEYLESGSIWDFIIPMAVLIAIAIVTSDLLFAVIITLFVCFAIYIPRKIVSIDNFVTIVINGFAEMLPTVAIVLVGFLLERFVSEMGMTDFIIDNITPFLSRELFPAIIFILVAILTFTTGSNWGMSAVCIPIVFPLGAVLDANMILIMAAVMSGGAFGSHACFYSDATILASQSSGIDNIEHAATQLPYVIISSVLSVVAFAVCGYLM